MPSLPLKKCHSQMNVFIHSLFNNAVSNSMFFEFHDRITVNNEFEAVTA
jgi:hypothetical protein